MDREQAIVECMREYRRDMERVSLLMLSQKCEQAKKRQEAATAFLEFALRTWGATLEEAKLLEAKQGGKAC